MGSARPRAQRAAALGVVLLTKSSSGYFETYVEVGRVEPYADGVRDPVYLQGSFSASTLRLWGASPIQTAEDVFVVRLSSDDEWHLFELDDCWFGGRSEDYCCQGSVPNCWGGIFSYRRCCDRGIAARAFLATDLQGARAAASKLLFRYNLNESHFKKRRVAWRFGRHPAVCAYQQVRAPALPPEYDGHPETGLRAAFAVLAAAGLATRRVLHIGLQDGKSLDPLYPLIMMEGLQGLGLEADPAMVELARENLPQRIRINQSSVTPENIWRWARPLGPLDVVVVDIDSFECDVLEGLVDGALRGGKMPPSLLHFETNTAIPPPFRFARRFDAGYRGRPENLADMQLASTSCSLSYAVHAFGARGYDLLFFGSRHRGPLSASTW